MLRRHLGGSSQNNLKRFAIVSLVFETNISELMIIEFECNKCFGDLVSSHSNVPLKTFDPNRNQTGDSDGFRIQNYCITI